MTRPEAEAIILKWDLKARNDGKGDVRRKLWRILDALAGWQEPETAREALDGLTQTKEVQEVRAALGLTKKGEK